jgi:RimJ/RimL family protein N-acetyltransferase
MKTLGSRTDLFFSQLTGIVTKHAEYTAIHTPSNETFYWGNCLIFNRAPRLEDTDIWLETFRAEHGGAKHIAIGWDEAAPGETAGFLAAAPGLEFGVSSVLTATALHAPRYPNKDAELRPLESDADWAARLELTTAVKDYGAEYLSRENANRRRQVQSGHGVWFGAFLGERLVASMGVFNTGEGLGRFQTVDTHPDFERRGLCGTLLHHAGQHALEHLGVTELVIVADPAYHAQRIYESVGFQQVQTQYQLEKTDSSSPVILGA